MAIHHVSYMYLFCSVYLMVPQDPQICSPKFNRSGYWEQLFKIEMFCRIRQHCSLAMFHILTGWAWIWFHFLIFIRCTVSGQLVTLIIIGSITSNWFSSSRSFPRLCLKTSSLSFIFCGVFTIVLFDNDIYHSDSWVWHSFDRLRTFLKTLEFAFGVLCDGMVLLSPLGKDLLRDIYRLEHTRTVGVFFHL